MKKTILGTMTVAFLCMTTLAQNVNIPDANFKAYLVGNSAINTNSDSEIQVSEATAFSGGIYCFNLSISDLTGIEFFTNLTVLRCNENSLATLDLSNNTDLVELRCQENFLTTVDLSNNTSLIELNCNNNALSTLNLTNNINLEQLRCEANSLTSLDVSNNSQLDFISCGSNPLTSIDLSNNPQLTFFGCNYNSTLMTLDVSNNSILTQIYCNDTPISALNVANGNNANFTTFVATNTPNLTCIQVDDVNYSTSNWTIIDATASFSLDCNFGLGLIEENISEDVTIYPNPTSSKLTIQSDEQIEVISITDFSGKVIETNCTTNSIDVSDLPNGIYFLRLQTVNGVSSKRFVKE